MVEPFGHRDLATNEPNEFHESNLQFRDALQSALGELAFPPQQCFFLLDKCFLHHDDPTLLLRVLALLRRNLLLPTHRPQLLRGAMVAKPVKLISNGGADLNAAGWEIYGRTEDLKGLGLWIDRAALASKHLNSKQREWLSNWTFENLSVPHAANPLPTRFLDLRLDTPWTSLEEDDTFDTSSEIFTFVATRHLVRLFRESYNRGARIARFFIPLLINWITFMEMHRKREESPATEGESGVPIVGKKRPKTVLDKDGRANNDLVGLNLRMPGVGLDYFIAQDQLQGLRDVPGGDLVFVSLIRRLYEERLRRKRSESLKDRASYLEKNSKSAEAKREREKVDQELNEMAAWQRWNERRFEHLYHFAILGCPWFVKRMQSDDGRVHFPDSLLSRDARRQYYYDLANVRPLKRKRPTKLSSGLVDDATEVINSDE